MHFLEDIVLIFLMITGAIIILPRTTRGVIWMVSSQAYMIGEFLQDMGRHGYNVPHFLTGHLSDFGGPLMFGVCMLLILQIHKTTHPDPFSHKISKAWIFLINLYMIAVILFELTQLHTGRDKEALIDIGVEIAGYTLLRWIISGSEFKKSQVV